LSLVVFISTFALAGVQQGFFLFLEAAYGLDRVGASAFLSVLAISGLLVQAVVLPLLVKRMDLTKILVLGLLLQLMQSALLAAVHAKWALGLACVCGGFGSLVFPCISAMKANGVTDQEQGRIQGAVSALQSAGLGVGPVLFSSLFAYVVGPRAPGGHPVPGAAFVLPIAGLLPALAIAMTIYPHLPEELRRPATPPPILRRVSIVSPSSRRASSLLGESGFCLDGVAADGGSSASTDAGSASPSSPPAVGSLS